MTIEKKFNMFQDLYCPMRIYCRLRDLEFSKRDAIETARYYEKWFYEPLIDFLKFKIKKREWVEPEI